MGCLQTKQPLRREVGIRPALLLIRPVATDPRVPLLLPQNAPQSPAYPAVQPAAHIRMATPEVPQPAPQRPVQVRDDRTQAAAGRPLRLGSHRRLQFLQALLPNVAVAPFVAIAQKLEGHAAGRDDAGLVR